MRLTIGIVCAGSRSAWLDGLGGKPLWHTRVGNISNSPQTYTVGGKQQVLVAVGDTPYAFKLY